MYIQILELIQFYLAEQDDTNDKDIPLTKIKFSYIPPEGGTAYTSTYNSLKSSNI